MNRILAFVIVIACAFPGWSGEPRMSLSITTGGQQQSLSPAQQAQRALWNDPMMRLMRAMDAEFGHLLIGQPGGRTPPAIAVGVGGGLPPRILSAALENSLAPISEPPAAIVWPWIKQKENEPAPPPMEEQLALLLGQRLEQKLGP